MDNRLLKKKQLIFQLFSYCFSRKRRKFKGVKSTSEGDVHPATLFEKARYRVLSTGILLCAYRRLHCKVRFHSHSLTMGNFNGVLRGRGVGCRRFSGVMTCLKTNSHRSKTIHRGGSIQSIHFLKAFCLLFPKSLKRDP